jgi:hypothetical protein
MRPPYLRAPSGIEWFIRTMKVGLRLPSCHRYSLNMSDHEIEKDYQVLRNTAGQNTG